MGSSLGGVAALNCAWTRPDVFGMAGCLSATFGMAADLPQRVLRAPRPPLRIYLDSGWPGDNYEVNRDMRARLVRAGFNLGTDLLYFAFPGHRHNENAWGERCHLPFQFFFGYRPDVRSQAGFAVEEASDAKTLQAAPARGKPGAPAEKAAAGTRAAPPAKATASAKATAAAKAAASAKSTSGGRSAGKRPRSGS
jgi:hypothetical protein